jgi:hypothetical protein
MAGDDLRRGSGESEPFPTGVEKVVAMCVLEDPRYQEAFRKWREYE